MTFGLLLTSVCLLLNGQFDVNRKIQIIWSFFKPTQQKNQIFHSYDTSRLKICKCIHWQTRKKIVSFILRIRLNYGSDFCLQKIKIKIKMKSWFDHMFQQFQKKKRNSNLQFDLFTEENPGPFSAHVYFPLQFLTK